MEQADLPEKGESIIQNRLQKKREAVKLRFSQRLLVKQAEPLYFRGKRFLQESNFSFSFLKKGIRLVMKNLVYL